MKLCNSGCYRTLYDVHEGEEDEEKNRALANKLWAGEGDDGYYDDRR